MVSFVSASVVGVPSKTAWSSTATIKHTFGEVVFAVSWSGNSRAPIDGRRFVKALDTLRWKTPQDLYTTLQKWLHSLEGEQQVSLALIAQPAQGNALLITHGGSSIALWRAGEGRWLVPPTVPRQILEGEVRLGDRLVLQTAGAAPLRIDLTTLHQLDVENLAGQYYSRAQQLAETSLAAVVLVEVHGLESREEQASVAPPERAAEPLSHLIDPDKLSAGIQRSLAPRRPTRPRRLPLAALPAPSWQRLRLPALQLLAVCALIGGVMGGVVLYRGLGVQKEYREVVAPLESSAQSLVQLGEEERAQRRQSVADLLERATATKVTYNANKRRLEALQASLQQQYDAISGQKNVIELPVFYDFRLAKSGFLAQRASVSNGTAYFYDSGSHQALALDLATKKNEQVDVQNLLDVRDFVVVRNTLYALQPDRVSAMPLSNNTVKVMAPIPSAQEPTLLAHFGDNLYAFDRSYQQLWRLSTTDANATPSAWVRSARGVNFGSVTSLSINGSIWMGTSEGTIYKFTRGERENFSPQGMLAPFTSSLLVATTPEGELLVVVEPAKKRVVVLGKDGEYRQQIESEHIGGVTDVFLEEDESAVYLVGGSVVYRIGL